MKKLLSPEENPGYDPETHAPPVSLYAKTRQPGSTIQVPVLAYILIAVALLLLAAGFFVADNAITQTAAFAAAAVVAILARIAQAGSHHRHLMDELQRRRWDK